MRVLCGWGSAGGQQRLSAALLAFFASMIVTSVAAQGSVVTVTTTSLPAATVGVHYTAPPLSATGGTPPYIFVVAGLPPTLSVNREGVFSGTPTEPGNFTLTIIAMDSAPFKHRSIPKKVTLEVKAPPLTVTTASLSSGSWEKVYSTPLAASGGTRPYTFTAIGLPKGLSVTGNAITGAPTQAGTFSVSITVTDSTPRALAAPTLR